MREKNILKTWIRSVKNESPDAERDLAGPSYEWKWNSISANLFSQECLHFDTTDTGKDPAGAIKTKDCSNFLDGFVCKKIK